MPAFALHVMGCNNLDLYIHVRSTILTLIHGCVRALHVPYYQIPYVSKYLCFIATLRGAGDVTAAECLLSPSFHLYGTHSVGQAFFVSSWPP
jgi:spore maturation protein SpmB